MDLPTSNPWEESGEYEGLVSIGSHRLFLQAAGPARKPGQPVVIIIQGLASISSSWSAVARLLSQFVRVIRYDRSGLGKSESTPMPPNCSNIVRGLRCLLAEADIKPPYILIAHSWGGILSREFIDLLKPRDVVGLVLVEANQERTLEMLDWRPLVGWISASEINVLEVSGLREKHRLTPKEWQQYLVDENNKNFDKQRQAEFAEYGSSFGMLASKARLHQDPPYLGRVPVSVIKGQNGAQFRKLYQAVVERGFGTESDQARFRNLVERFDQDDTSLQSELLCLSSCSRFVEALRSGHNVHLTEPEVIVKEVKWTIGAISSKGEI